LQSQGIGKEGGNPDLIYKRAITPYPIGFTLASPFASGEEHLRQRVVNIITGIAISWEAKKKTPSKAGSTKAPKNSTGAWPKKPETDLSANVG
jgi:hypothetical protein